LRVAHWCVDHPTRQVDRVALCSGVIHLHDFIDKFVLNTNRAIPPSFFLTSFIKWIINHMCIYIYVGLN